MATTIDARTNKKRIFLLEDLWIIIDNKKLSTKIKKAVLDPVANITAIIINTGTKKTTRPKRNLNLSCNNSSEYITIEAIDIYIPKSLGLSSKIVRRADLISKATWLPSRKKIDKQKVPIVKPYKAILGAISFLIE